MGGRVRVPVELLRALETLGISVGMCVDWCGPQHRGRALEALGQPSHIGAPAPGQPSGWERICEVTAFEPHSDHHPFLASARRAAGQASSSKTRASGAIVTPLFTSEPPPRPHLQGGTRTPWVREMSMRPRPW